MKREDGEGSEGGSPRDKMGTLMATDDLPGMHVLTTAPVSLPGMHVLTTAPVSLVPQVEVLLLATMPAARCLRTTAGLWVRE